MNNIFSFRKKFLVAAILLYKKEQKSENRPRTPPAPLNQLYSADIEIYIENS